MRDAADRRRRLDIFDIEITLTGLRDSSRKTVSRFLLRVLGQDLHKNAGAGGGLGLLHDVLDVLFDGLLHDAQFDGDLFVGPALDQLLDHSLLAVG